MRTCKQRVAFLVVLLGGVCVGSDIVPNTHVAKVFRDGEAYSLAGNMTPMMWVQVQQYEEACVDPTRAGW